MQMKPFLPSFKRALDCSLPSFKQALDCSLPSCHVRAKQSTAEMHVRTAIQHGRSGRTGLLPDLAAAPLGQERLVPPALPCWIAYFLLKKKSCSFYSLSEDTAGAWTSLPQCHWKGAKFCPFITDKGQLFGQVLWRLSLHFSPQQSTFSKLFLLLFTP